MGFGRILIVGLAAPLPAFLKRALYKLLGYKIGKRVRIGFSIIHAGECEIGDDVSIGHFNVITGVKKITIGEHSRIGVLNIIRGGEEVRIGRYCDILRLNEINSIPEPDVVNEIDPRFLMGDGSMIGASHKIDFTDRVEFGKSVIFGGRNSSIWTHNRQKTKPVSVGDHSYLGSEIRMAPGSRIPAKCIVGLASVITKAFSEEYKLIAGFPAKEIKDLNEEDRFLIEQKTRKDLPNDI